MQPFLISTASVALAELGDKTQLLALVLAAKYRRPWLIALGILLATLANHALAGAFGSLYGDGDMRASVGTNFTYLQNLALGLSYNAFLGSANPAKRPYADRDYAAINVKYSF